MKKYKLLSICLIVLLISSSVIAQKIERVNNNTLFYKANNNSYRSSDGTPGPLYWQNTADYKAKVKLDTVTNIIKGNVEISYTNHSPNKLNFVWLQLDQNILKSNSRANSANFKMNSGKEDYGYNISKVQVLLNGKWQDANYLVNDTRMQIRLRKSISPKGGNLKIAIKYNYKIGNKAGRTGFVNTKNGRIYEVAYFYPRMCVYDDLRGWNTLPFLGSGEFFLDYGNIDFTVTVPKGMLVMGSGRLMNSEETLTKKELKRLQKAKNSDKIVFLRTQKEMLDENKKLDKKPVQYISWHFKMNNTRDVAWAASKAFIWDAAKINLPNGKRSLAMSVYPVESIGKASWSRATEYLKNAVEIFSKKWFVYPYPVAINVAGGVGGMEYPGITFDSWKSKSKHLWALLSHEIGHNWFPMIVGSNERRNAFMDEGFNTFIDIYAQKEFNNGEYAPKRDGEYAPKGGNPAEEIISILTKQNIPPIMAKADDITREDTHPVSYFKTAFGLVLLREIILGNKKFDYAFKQYIHNWAFKHPSPNDFFNAMDNGVGEDLSWFWNGWFYNNWLLDQAIISVHYIDGNYKNGVEITLSNNKKLKMPVLVTITQDNGKIINLKLPVEIWRQGATYKFKVDTSHKIKSVILDKKHQLPDVDRTNNSWFRK